jgi:hypothetical protein
VKVHIVVCEYDGQLDINAFSNEKGAQEQLTAWKQETLNDARSRGYNDVPTTLEQADGEGYFDVLGQYYTYEVIEVQP